MQVNLEIHCAGIASVLTSIHKRALIERDEDLYIRRTVSSARSRVAPWALDMRRPLSCSRLLRPIASAMGDLLVEDSCNQIVGYGYGAYLLIGGILASNDELVGGMLRSEKKQYGFRRLLEGAISQGSPVALVDDLLSSGNSAIYAAGLLRRSGYDVTAVYTVFDFEWRAGRGRLNDLGLLHRSLGTLHKL